MVTVATLFALVGAMAQASDSPRTIVDDTLVVGKKAYYVMPPEVVSPGTSKLLSWSPDGANLAVVRTVVKPNNPVLSRLLGTPIEGLPSGENQLVLYSRSQDPNQPGKVATVYRGPLTGMIQEVAWVTGTNRLMIPVTLVDTDTSPPTTSTAIYSITTSGLAKEFMRVPGQAGAMILPSPTKAMVAIVQSPDDAHPQRYVVTFCDKEGRTLCPPVEGAWSYNILWNKDGTSLSIGAPKRDNGKFSIVWSRLRPYSTKLEPLTKPEYEREAESTLDYEVASNGFELPGTEKFGHAVGLIDKARKNRVVVSMDGTNGMLAPDGKAVAYLHHDVAMVRPITAVNLEAYMALKMAAEKSEVISDAKQVGTALIIFAADWDDKLMSNSEDWKSKVKPYLKNDKLMNGFVYLFGGGNLNSVDDPAGTIMGYKQGPGGRAVVYLDGHVKWENNP